LVIKAVHSPKITDLFCELDLPRLTAGGINRERSLPYWRRHMKMTYRALLGAIAGLAFATAAMADDITGAGSTFV